MEEARKVKYSRKFLKSAAKLPKRIIAQAEEKEQIFREDPFDARLRTHKLTGRESEVWAFWINESYRVTFSFLRDKEVLFLDIGTHKIYK